MTILSGARVVTPTEVISSGWVEIADGRIVDVGAGRAPSAGLDLGGGWLLPGLIDLHMHGGGGYDVTRSADDMLAAVRFHRTHGTTSTLVSLMAARVDALCEQLSWAVALYRRGEIAGVHLEGPFLAAARCGAQNRDHLLDPDPLVLAKLLDAGLGCIRTVTIAPELPGALDLIADIRAAGAIAAVGHSDATYEQASAAFDAGAALATHLFNAMGPINQRAPGVAVAALDAGVPVELINDGVHVHAALVRLVARAAPGQLALVTDAISATGVGDGHYTLGDQLVEVRGGRARLDGSDHLAGSTLTMDEAVRRSVAVNGLTIQAASSAASAVPAQLLGIADRRGSIAPGLDADLVLLDDDLHLQGVMIRGNWQ
jgi:N-acetylglucosamine-6-phosphate deacetylase